MEPPKAPRLFDPEQATRRGKFLINLAYLSLLVGIGVLIVRYLLVFMLPFVLAFVVAAILQRPLRFLVAKTRISRKIFSVALVVLLVLLLAGSVTFAVWRLWNWLYDFATNSETQQIIRNSIASVAENVTLALDRLSNSLSATMGDILKNSVDRLTSGISDLMGKIPAFSVTFATRLPSFIIGFVMWIVASVFLTIEYEQVINFFMRQVPARHYELVSETRRLFSTTIFKLIRAYILLMLITFVELSVGLTILGIERAIMLSAIIAVIDILPVLGTGAVLIPWAVISLLLGDLRNFIGLLALYGIVLIIRNIVEPRLVSNQIGLNPLVTLFCMYLGLRTVGLLGMLLFPMIAMVLTQLQEHGHLKLWK